MGYQHLPKEKKNNIGREREIILNFSEGTVEKEGKDGTIKQYLAASFAKQTYFRKVLPITATNFNRLYLSESKKPFLIVREKATLLSTLIEVPLLSPTSPARCSRFTVRKRNSFPQAAKPVAGLHHHPSLDEGSRLLLLRSKLKSSKLLSPWV